MVSFASVALLALAHVSCLVNAIPLVGRASLDVAAPPVTYPTKGVVWNVGDTQTVTWDTSKLPSQITNPVGQVVLGWLDDKGYNLQLNDPLASGFSITAGKVDIVVPSKYPNGDSYIIALIGSSDNISPSFTIAGGSSSSGTDNIPSTSNPPVQPTSVAGTPSSTTLGSDSSVMYDAPSPSSNPLSSTPHSSDSSSHSPSVSSSSPSSSGTPGSSNGNTTSGNSAWVNKPANSMVISLLVASLVTLFL